MPSNHTPNYGLSQWERSDKILMEDFNADNAKIDGALATLAEASDEHAAAIAKLGNCAIHYAAFEGDNTAYRTYTFPHKPLFFVLADASNSGRYIAVVRGITSAYYFHSNGAEMVTVSWGSNSVTVKSAWGLNSSTHAYHMITLLDMEN